jgi:hypothetical protein
LELWFAFCGLSPGATRSGTGRAGGVAVFVNPAWRSTHNVVGHQMIRVCCWNDPRYRSSRRCGRLRRKRRASDRGPDPRPAHGFRARVIARDLLPPVVTRRCGGPAGGCARS